MARSKLTSTQQWRVAISGVPVPTDALGPPYGSWIRDDKSNGLLFSVTRLWGPQPSSRQTLELEVAYHAASYHASPAVLDSGASVELRLPGGVS